MKVLITGINGFVGSYLTETLLKDANVEIFGTTRPGTDLNNLQNPSGVSLIEAELTDKDSAKKVIEKVTPDHIYHLAAIVQTHNIFPRDVYEVNILATLNLLEAVREEELKSRILLVGTAHEYGSTKDEDSPIKEDQPLKPIRSYGASKAAQSLMGYQYFKEFGLDILRTRSFNHAGAKRSDTFVEGAFARQIAEIEKGLKEPKILVGNLQSKGDFSHVQDVCSAYTLLMEKGVSGEVYNVGSGVPHTIKELLDTLLSFSTVEVKVEQDKERFRPTEVFYADVSKLKALGWKPQFSFERMLEETLNWWREKV